MASPLLSPPQSTARGIALLLGAVVMFTLMDAAGKELTHRYDPSQVVFMRMAINLAAVLVVLAPQLRRIAPSRVPLQQIGRGLGQFGSIAFFFAALKYIGLAEAAAVFALNPVLITLGAALFLGERVGWRRMLGIAVALSGAIIIIRPGMGVFHPAALLPLLSAISYSAAALLTRITRVDHTGTSILWATAVATIAATVPAGLVWQTIQPADWWLFLTMGLLGTLGQVMVIRAFTVAEAGAIAPFGYAEVLTSTLWGWLFFAALPDRWTVLGAAVIVAAGIYVWWREMKLSRIGQASPRPATAGTPGAVE